MTSICGLAEAEAAPHQDVAHQASVTSSGIGMAAQDLI
jgi:hypothetical protein